MIRTVFCTTLALVAGSAIICYADAKDDATAAADKLAKTSYSWKTAVENGGGGGGGRGGFGGPQEGKTADGITAITTSNNGNDRTRYIKGDKTVMQNQDGEWMTTEEMAAARGNGNGGNANGGRRGRRGAGGPGGAQPLPAEAVKDMISKTKSLTMADGAFSGELTEDAAKASLMGGGRGGRRGGANGGNAGAGNGPEITDAKATVKVWVKDGVISKYESHVSGKVSFNGNDRDVDRTTTVEISNVGSTKVDVPADAAKKLG